MTKEIYDQLARDKIKGELGTNFLVEAGAGSGKTTSLVERMVNLIYTGAAQIQEIVAITFTRKAADELKVRFQIKLEEAWKKESEIDREFVLGEALKNNERCFLGTVHSFCTRLLRERPIEANLDLAFTELEQADDEEILKEAWQLHLQRLMLEDPRKIEEIEELGMNIEQVFPWVKDLKDYTDVEWMAEAVSKPMLLECYEQFIVLLKEAKRCIPNPEPEKGYDDFQKTILTALQKGRVRNQPMDKEIIEVFHLFNKKLKATQYKWSSKEDAKFYEEKISAFFEDSINPCLQRWKEYCHSKIIAFIQEALLRYEQLKTERSLLNFQDLMQHTAKLLKENTEVRRYFQDKYRFLLVDEFQDTDPLQAEIMFYLTSDNVEEKTWTNCKPKSGSLFVVGDPKQAIYRFRRADIDTYNRVKQLIEEHGGEVLQLTTNFRTLDSITTELNKIFEQNFPETETVYQAAYRPLVSFHEDKGNGVTGIKRLSVPTEFTKKDDVILKDAENIAQTIQNLIKQGYSAKDFMVLTRYTEGIATYANMIERMEIPVSISGEVIFGETREFQDLWILLSSFIELTDEVKFVAVLRGMFFGMSDAELYQWKQAGGRFSIFAETPNELADGMKAKFALALKKLQTCQRFIRSYSPTAAIEKIIEEIGFYPLLLQNGRGKRTYKSLLQIIEVLRKHESSGNTTYKQIIERFTELIFEKTEVANIEEEANAVRVMNVHKAKGLEASIVFLAHPAKSVNPENFLSKFIKREDHSSKGYFTFSVKNGNHSKEVAIPTGWENYRNEEFMYLTEEELRILYVATTRAEKALIISSSGGNKKNPWSILFGIDNLVEMELREGEVIPPKINVQDINLVDFQTKIAAKGDWLKQSKTKTYDHWTPTMEKDFSEITIEREAGGGKEWGTLIHDVFEKAVQGVDLTYYIRSALSKYGIPVEREEEVKAYLQKLKNSSIWAEIQTAEEVLTEVPFSLKVEKGHKLYALITNDSQTNHPYLVKGMIDLIYKRNGSWTIVDYKTDRAKHEEDVQKLADFYQSQILFYKRAWEELINENVYQHYLYFLEPNRISY